MLNRILEIQEENRYLSLKRGFIIIQQEDEIIASLPLDDVSVLLLSAQRITLTKNIINALSERGCIIVCCGKNYNPVSMTVPVASHYLFTKIIKNQINASLPLKKRLWQQIVIKKIQHQALALHFCEKDAEAKKINKIATLVKSGDPDNREAYAARMYWKYLFGDSFIRDKDRDGLNSLLNYGYAIMRASMARAICAAGLIPALGIHHDNNMNQFCLADDLFEIYRPIIDCLTYKLFISGNAELNTDVKKEFAESLKIQVQYKEMETPVFRSMHYLVASVVKSFDEKKVMIELPEWKGNNNGITIIK